MFVETKSVGRSSRVSAEELRFQRELEDALRMSADETASSGKLRMFSVWFHMDQVSGTHNYLQKLSTNFSKPSELYILALKVYFEASKLYHVAPEFGTVFNII